MRRAWDWLRKQEKEQLDGSWTEVDRDDAEEDQPLNRRQRRMYNRLVQLAENPTPEQRAARRHTRKYVVGFGAWRRWPGRAQRSALARRLGQP